MHRPVGTPRNSSCLIVTEENNRDKFALAEDTENTVPPTIGTPPTKKKSKVVRIWHPDSLFKTVNDNDLQSITSFKSALVTETTTAAACRSFVAGKLQVEDESQFRVYSIKNQEKTALADDYLLYKLFEEDSDIKLAFLVAGNEGNVKTIIGASLFELKGDYDVREGSTLTHRRLLNSDFYSPIANVIFKTQNTKIYSFRALIEIRCPQLLELDEMIKRRKEKKSSNRIIMTIVTKDESIFTPPILVQILDYLYSDNLDFAKLKLNEILLVQKAATLLSINRLVWLCERYLFTVLAIHNVYEIMKLADDLQVTVVKDFCVVFAKNNWKEFSANKRGLDILGLDLFQEIAVKLHSNTETFNQSYLDVGAPPSLLISDLKRLYDVMEYTDATVVFNDGKVIPFHRCFFAGHEKRFAQLFIDKKDTHKPFRFPISSQTFTYLQQYIYYGSCEISPESACEIIEEMVAIYDLDQFRDKCEDTISKEIRSDIVLRYLMLTYASWNSARTNLVTEFRKECLLYVADHFNEVDIPSIRNIKPCGINIAHDLLDVLHELKRSTKGKTGSKMTKQLSFK